MQGGWSPQPLQQPLQPQQPLQQPLQQQQPARQPAPLARQQYAAAPVFLELSQVLNKQVVTRTSGRSLGSISGAWLDPSRGALVSFDLDERRSGPGGAAGRGLSTPARAGNIPLSALRQIGDVVLVHDEGGLYEQDLDGRLGFVNPVGLGVRTATGEFLGKVRDLSFSPDSGAIARITYDEFGLPFLPISFFDCYSVALADVLSIGRTDLIVYDDAKYRERKESAGLFAAIPSLLKSLNAPRLASPQLALPAPGGTSDMYRLGAAGAAGAAGGGRYLPADYTYEQWQADLRRWEAETGMTYEQYLRSQPPQQQAAAPLTALPPGRTAPAQAGYAAAGGYGAYAAPQQQQQRPQPGYTQAPQQQPMQQPQQQQQYGQSYGQQQMRPQQQPQQQQQPRYAGQPAAGAGWGAAAAAGQQAPGASQQFAAAGYNPAAAAAAGGAPGMAGLQQQQPLQQQQQSPRRSQVQPLQQQQQQPQQTPRAAGAAPVGTARTTAPRAAAPAAAPQQPQQASQQQQQQAGRRVDEWMVRETRPRIADALADGVLPLTDEAANAAAAENSAAGGGQAQQQPQEVV